MAHPQTNDASQDSGPYRPARDIPSPRQPPPVATSPYIVALAAMIPAALSVGIAYATIGLSLQHTLTQFYFYGGHALLLALIWCLTVARLRSRKTDSGILGASVMIAVFYIVAAVLSWAIVAFFVFLDAVWWP